MTAILTEVEYDFIYQCIADEDAPREAKDVAFELCLERELLLVGEFSMSGTATGIMKNEDERFDRLEALIKEQR